MGLLALLESLAGAGAELGCRQVGKALGFDPSMRRFESCHPSHGAGRTEGRVSRGVAGP